MTLPGTVRLHRFFKIKGKQIRTSGYNFKKVYLTQNTWKWCSLPHLLLKHGGAPTYLMLVVPKSPKNWPHHTCTHFNRNVTRYFGGMHYWLTSLLTSIYKISLFLKPWVYCTQPLEPEHLNLANGMASGWLKPFWMLKKSSHTKNQFKNLLLTLCYTIMVTFAHWNSKIWHPSFVFHSVVVLPRGKRPIISFLCWKPDGFISCKHKLPRQRKESFDKAASDITA